MKWENPWEWEDDEACAPVAPVPPVCEDCPEHGSCRGVDCPLGGSGDGDE